MALNLKNDRPSKLGFGCMRLPVRNGRAAEIDYKTAEEMIDEAYIHGVNYFDTAYTYHEQKSEIFLGNVLKKYPRESYYLADKMPGWLVKKREDAAEIFNTQQKRCQTDYFDFYLCHALSHDKLDVYEKEGVYEFLYQKKNQGVIRNLGFSFHDTPEVLEMILDKYEWDFVQIQLNYLDWDRQEAKRLYEILKKRNIPCTVMEPVRGGALAQLCPEAVEILEKECPGRSPASWALRFAAGLPGVMTVLSGMSDEAQVKENINTLVTDFKPLSRSEQGVLMRARDIYLQVMTIPCTDCKYCSGCPEWIDIPKIFSMYNDYKISKHAETFKKDYQALGLANADACIRCGRCMRLCPQGIKIPERLKEISILTQSI